MVTRPHDHLVVRDRQLQSQSLRSEFAACKAEADEKLTEVQAVLEAEL